MRKPPRVRQTDAPGPERPSGTAAPPGSPVPDALERTARLWHWRADPKGLITGSGAGIEELLGYRVDEVVGRVRLRGLFRPEAARALLSRLVRNKPVARLPGMGVHRAGHEVPLMTSAIAVAGRNGRSAAYVGISVECSELLAARTQLDRQADEHRRLAAEGRAKLEEFQKTINSILDQRDFEKRALEEGLLANLKQFVLPYLDELQKHRLEPEATLYVNLIRSNLANITSPFSRTLSAKYLAMSHRETHVAELIRQGKSSKEIATLLRLSPSAVSFHRYNIRRKLGLLKEKVNLAVYLNALPR
jgi:DNA-binding CsgD family transcriptional regulator